MIPTEEQVPDGSTDFSREDAADVTVGIGHDIDGLKFNNASVSSDYYDISDDGQSITIDKDYLAAMSNGTKEFSIILDDDNTTPTAVLWDVVISGAHADEFDRSDPDDVTMSVTDAEITGLEYQGEDVDASAYAISNSDHTITIKKEYLATLSNGDKAFKVLEGEDAYDELVIEVIGNGSASFSKADPAEITIEVVDAEITGLKIGGTNVNTDNYTIAEGAHSITIDDDYLGGLANGDKTFKILLEDETEVTYVITVGD